jgi:CRISPR-associated protein Cas2
MWSAFFFPHPASRIPPRLSSPVVFARRSVWSNSLLARRAMHYLIAYDICCPRRLRRVARFLEKHAIRCQKSVFVFRGAVEKLNEIMDETAKLIDEDEDLVQAWKLANQESPRGLRRGTAPVLFPEAAIMDDDGVRGIGESF